jgi:glucokinase
MSDAANNRSWIGFDLGGTKMLAAVFDAKLNLLGSERKKTKAADGVESTLERIIRTITSAIDSAKIPAQSIAGIGIGCPGALDLTRGVVLDAPNLGWKETKLRKTLEAAFHCPVVLVNDVDAGVYGEYARGSAQKARCALGVFPGTGIGGGCVYEGSLIVGATTSCMEIGHIEVLPDGPLCGCGKRGCLEAVASRLAISSAAAEAVYRGDAPALQRLAGTDIAAMRSSVLAQSIAAGDTSIERIVRQAAHWLGRGVANAIDLLAPDLVLLGGGLVEAMPELYLQEVEKSARAHVMPALSGIFKVAVGQLGDQAAAIGAAAWARRSIETRSTNPS